jgi:hypothetical protein
MSSFTKALLEPTGKTYNGRAIYRVAGEFTYDIGFVGSGLQVTVPQGFETDGPSVPSWLLWLIPVGQFVRAAAVHDCLREDLRFGKMDGDGIFLSALAAEGVSGWRRLAIFLGVYFNSSRKVVP